MRGRFTVILYYSITRGRYLCQALTFQRKVLLMTNDCSGPAGLDRIKFNLRIIILSPATLGAGASGGGSAIRPRHMGGGETIARGSPL